MKTKLRKYWYDREKSVQELHEDSKQWISEINLIMDEMRFLDHLLSSKYIDCLDAGLFKKIKRFVEDIADEKIAGEALKEVIQKHEIILAELIENDCVESNKNFLQTHKNIQKEIRIYTKKYRNIKKEIFNVVENVMRKKDQKKLI